LNAAIAAFPKPYVVLMDGLVMGGGVGVSAHGNCRIVTERTRLAMPETGIGFIPDVGGTWLLTRKNGAGVYLALSGATIGAADALDLGLADALIASARLPQFLERLSTISSAAEVDAAVSAFRSETETGELSGHKGVFDDALSADCVEDVIASLQASDDAFARAAAAEIAGKSPTSLKVTHALLKRARVADRLETCLINEYRAACSLLDGHDLYEGIRAAVVDKDKTPKWSPDSLAGVDEATVARILAGTGDPDPVFSTS
jgi:enoyl-CoA hydratase